MKSVIFLAAEYVAQPGVGPSEIRADTLTTNDLTPLCMYLALKESRMAFVKRTTG